jgi:hypothetical protein
MEACPRYRGVYALLNVYEIEMDTPLGTIIKVVVVTSCL